MFKMQFLVSLRRFLTCLNIPIEATDQKPRSGAMWSVSLVKIRFAIICLPKQHLHASTNSKNCAKWNVCSENTPKQPLHASENARNRSGSSDWRDWDQARHRKIVDFAQNRPKQYLHASKNSIHDAKPPKRNDFNQNTPKQYLHASGSSEVDRKSMPGGKKIPLGGMIFGQSRKIFLRRQDFWLPKINLRTPKNEL